MNRSRLVGVAVVVIVGLVLTGASLGYVLQRPGVHYSSVSALFMAPASSQYPNRLVTTSSGVVATAGLVESLINGPDSGRVRHASSRVTLLGEGEDDTSLVRLPDNGGQWAPNFNEQRLVLEVVGAEPDLVGERQRALMADVEQRLQSLQRAAKVADVNLITVRFSPSTPEVSYHNGNPKRATAMTLLLGLGATYVAALAALRLKRSAG